MADVLLAWLETWPPVAALRQSAWGYPLVSWAHLMGLGTMLGAVAVMDLRLLGRFADLERDALLAALAPVALWAFAAAACSGLLLFAPAGREYLANPYFVAKLGVMGLAGLNACMLHAGRRRGHGTAPARLHGAMSAVLWCTVVFCARMLAFG